MHLMNNMFILLKQLFSRFLSDKCKIYFRFSGFIINIHGLYIYVYFFIRLYGFVKISYVLFYHTSCIIIDKEFAD